MLQQWRVVGNTMFDLTGPRYEPQTSRYGDERVTARPTSRFCFTNLSQLFQLFYVKLLNRINTPSIFCSVKFAFGIIEEKIIQKNQLVFKHLLF